MWRMLNVLMWIVGGYTLVLVLLYAGQHWLLYQPIGPLISSPDEMGMAYEDVELLTEDGETLHGWWIPAQEDRGTLAFFHGNAGNISGRLESIRQFHHLGLNVFILDYRGYGRSSGTPSEEGLYLDADATWRYLTEKRGISPDRLVLFGRSLGTGVASWLAAEREAAALLMESPFTSVPDLASKIYSWFPARALTRAQYDTESRMKEIDLPVLVLHSEDDRIIPYELGRAVYDAANEPKQFMRLEGGHNDGYLRSEPRYSTRIDRFLSAHGINRTGDRR